MHLNVVDSNAQVSAGELVSLIFRKKNHRTLTRLYRQEKWGDIRKLVLDTAEHGDPSYEFSQRIVAGVCLIVIDQIEREGRQIRDRFDLGEAHERCQQMVDGDSWPISNPTKLPCWLKR